MKPRQELIDRKGSREHIDADDCRTVRLHTGDITVFHLLVVGGGIVPPQARGSNFLHCEQAATHQT
jgi:hypothetical protein